MEDLSTLWDNNKKVAIWFEHYPEDVVECENVTIHIFFCQHKLKNKYKSVRHYYQTLQCKVLRIWLTKWQKDPCEGFWKTKRVQNLERETENRNLKTIIVPISDGALSLINKGNSTTKKCFCHTATGNPKYSSNKYCPCSARRVFNLSCFVISCLLFYWKSQQITSFFMHYLSLR